MLAQSVQSTSACSGMRPGSCKIEWRDEAGLIEPENRARRNGRRFIRKKRRSADCSIRRGSWDGAKRNGITSPTNTPNRYDFGRSAMCQVEVARRSLYDRGPLLTSLRG